MAQSMLLFYKNLFSYFWLVLRLKNIQFKNFRTFIKIINSDFIGSLIFFKRHSGCQVSILLDLICYDCPTYLFRFSFALVLFCIRFNCRIFVVVKTQLGYGLSTLSKLFCSSNWLEREIYDLFGIFFFDHPSLRKLLTDYTLMGNPLWKDFPLIGYWELRYNFIKHGSDYVPVCLIQALRTYKFYD